MATRKTDSLSSATQLRSSFSADDLAAIEETWEILGTPGAAEAINGGLADAAAGHFADNDALKSRYGVA